MSTMGGAMSDKLHIEDLDLKNPGVHQLVHVTTESRLDKIEKIFDRLVVFSISTLVAVILNMCLTVFKR